MAAVVLRRVVRFSFGSTSVDASSLFRRLDASAPATPSRVDREPATLARLRSRPVDAQLFRLTHRRPARPERAIASIPNAYCRPVRARLATNSLRRDPKEVRGSSHPRPPVAWRSTDRFAGRRRPPEIVQAESIIYDPFWRHDRPPQFGRPVSRHVPRLAENFDI